MPMSQFKIVLGNEKKTETKFNMIICYPEGIWRQDLWELFIQNFLTAGKYCHIESQKSMQNKRENKCGKYMWLVTIQY